MIRLILSFIPFFFRYINILLRIICIFYLFIIIDILINIGQQVKGEVKFLLKKKLIFSWIQLLKILISRYIIFHK